MKTLTTALLGVALLALPVSAGAQTMAKVDPPKAAPAAAPAPAAAAAPRATADGHSKASFIAANDANGDSVVSKAEFDAARAKQYAKVDANKDGTLTEAEYVGEYTVRLDAELAAQREAQLKQAHVRFGVLDTDKSKGMTATEFSASGQKMFTELDTNKDGVVDERDNAEAY